MAALKLDPIEFVLEEVRRGRPVVIVDDESRENEADLMLAAEKVTRETFGYLIDRGRTVICLTLTEERMRRLGIPEQQRSGISPYAAHFGASFSLLSAAADGAGAEGRVNTILAAVGKDPRPEMFVKPGFVFPIAAVPGGVLKRRGHTEASVDLAMLAGLEPAGVICEVMSPEGSMLCGAAVQDFCKSQGLALTSVEAIAAYRLGRETSIRRVAEFDWTKELGIDRGAELAELFAAFQGNVRVIVYVDDVNDEEHFAIVAGNPQAEALVRIHSECLTGDVFGSERCDCGEQFDSALKKILQAGSGVLIYLHQEGRGIGLGNKLRAYALQDQGLDTVDANLHLGFEPDLRDYRVAAQMLIDLQIGRIRLMTNNPEKLESLSELGISLGERVELEVPSGRYNAAYLATKQSRMGHLLSNRTKAK